MKLDKNFKLRQTTKRMLMNLFGAEKTEYKKMMIEAQLIADRPAPNNKDSKNKEKDAE